MVGDVVMAVEERMCMGVRWLMVRRSGVRRERAKEGGGVFILAPTFLFSSARLV